MKADPVCEYDVLLFGRYFCDLVFTHLPELPRLGHEVYAREFHLVPGGVFTPAATLTRLGLKTAWPCVFGSDPFSQFVKEKAIKAGVDQQFFTQSGQPNLRITVAFSFEQDRAFLSYADPLPEIPYPEMILRSNPKWVYITHLTTGVLQEKIISAARQIGASVLMDCQAHNTTIDDPETQKALDLVDVFSPNRNEALALTGEREIEKALIKLSKLVKTVVIKDGENGCLYGNVGKVIHIPAIEAEVVDTTGAGDNFNCGFLYGQIRGYSLQESLRIGNICGGLSTKNYGGSDFEVGPLILETYLKKKAA